jgi:adenylate cyclase
LRGEKPLSEKIVIVEIGDDTFGALDIQWPFPREYHARVIDNLKEAGARLVVFDIEFLESSNPEADKMLAESAQKAGNVVFSGKRVRTMHAQAVREQILPPIREITQRELAWGTVNISSDSDGFVRRYEMSQTMSERDFYAIGVVTLAKHYDKANWKEQITEHDKVLVIGNNAIPKRTKKSALINYYGPNRTFTYYDYADVIDDKEFEMPFLNLDRFEDLKEEGVFEDKIVLIGVSAVEFHDMHYTPFFLDNRQMTAGVEIHANFIEMALNRDYLHHLPGIVFFLISLLFALLIFVFNRLVKPIVSLFSSIVLIILLFIISYLTFVNSNILLPTMELPTYVITFYFVGLVSHYLKTSRERKFIKDAFGRYIAPELVEELIKDPRKLEYGGSIREITVMFSDVKSFTPYTESHEPKETVSILKEHLTAMVEVIMANKGTLDKFVGDEIVAIYGAPIDLEDHAYWACKSALEMRKKLEQLQDKWKRERRDPFDIGIGVNSGTATVGNLGSEQIFDYTAIGDTVNLGARLEAATRNYPTKHNIIISESTYLLAKDKIIAEYIDEIMVKGKTKPIKIYELLGVKEEL